MDDSIFLTRTELERLERTDKIRLDILNKMTENGIPDNNSSIRVLKEVADSLDTKILKLAELRLKQDSNDSENNHRDLVIEILKKPHVDNITDKVIEVDETLQTNDFVPGQDAIEPEKIMLSDIIKDK